MNKKDKLVIIGAGAFAEVAYEYFTYDSDYEVVAFSVEEKFLKKESLFDLPVIPFENVEKLYAPKEHKFFVAITYFRLNKVRTELYQQAKEKGYSSASYISPHAFVWKNCKIGEHCFIFEKSIVQPFVQIGNNVILWSGSFIGHHSTIGNHCFIGGHTAMNGTVKIGENTFLGSNCTIANHITVGSNCIISAGGLILSDMEDDQIVIGTWRKKTLTSSSRLNTEFFLE